MKVLILAGGRGRRFGAMTDSIPKPLVPIAGTPMIRRVMDIYAEQGFREFVIALGYRVDDVCDYFNETASTGDMVVEVAARPAAVSDLTPRELAAAPLPNGEKTQYLSELSAGDGVTIVNARGEQRDGIVGRVKIEKRPLTLVKAEVDGNMITTILQNAETIKLVGADGLPISIANLKVGDEVLVHFEDSARHFGMKIDETIIEK